jgi:pyruvate dehydrogenase E2 component (dihydrolipoamide acetyltransferase)
LVLTPQERGNGTAPVMATDIKLPRLGQGMESGTIVKWLKSEGDSVEKGEPLYELDTDKVTQEVESDASGVLLRIAVQEGEVEVGRTIAVIGDEGEEVASEADTAPQADESPEEEGSRAPVRDEERERGREASVATAEREATAEPAAAPARADGRVKASPLARRIARERGLDLAAIAGTGPEGRIVAEDVERAAEAPEPAPAPGPAAKEVEVVPLTSVRRTIARRLTEAWQAPVFQLTSSADMARSLELRERLVERAGEEVKPTISDLLTKLCALGLMRNRALNAHYVRDAIERHPSANVGIAVAAPQGLVVPVIRGCEAKSILEIAEVRAEVVGRARNNKLQRSDLEGGTFTISNLGMFGVEQFIAVLNPPQVAILAVGAIVERPVVEEGETVIRPMMTLTLTCDHRAVDGADGARFLADVKAFLEEPSLAL